MTSAEQVGKQRNQRNADQGHAAARHELFNALTFRSWIVVAVPFQKVDRAPNGKARAEGDHKGLENADCGMEETHNTTSNSDFENEKSRYSAALGSPERSTEYVLNTSSGFGFNLVDRNFSIGKALRES